MVKRSGYLRRRSRTGRGQAGPHPGSGGPQRDAALQDLLAGSWPSGTPRAVPEAAHRITAGRAECPVRENPQGRVLSGRRIPGAADPENLLAVPDTAPEPPQGRWRTAFHGPPGATGPSPCPAGTAKRPGPEGSGALFGGISRPTWRSWTIGDRPQRALFPSGNPAPDRKTHQIRAQLAALGCPIRGISNTRAPEHPQRLILLHARPFGWNCPAAAPRKSRRRTETSPCGRLSPERKR
jgi:hypothetical protein